MIRFPRRNLYFLSMLIISSAFFCFRVNAQQLDMSFQQHAKSNTADWTKSPERVAVTPTIKNVTSAVKKTTPKASQNGEAMKPISASISKSLYLPPAMYGQWNLTGTLIKTNDPDEFPTTTSTLWALERVDDLVTVTNLSNGASAAIDVDSVIGNQATFHHVVPMNRNWVVLETPTITVTGDTLHGQGINKMQKIKDGVVLKEYYGVYQYDAVRLTNGRTRFHPEDDGGPDIEIAPVQNDRH